jgi:hypothetical protein
MEPYVINRDSWHYKMISNGQHWDEYLSHRAPKDFCSYWRMVVGKLLTYAFFITLGTIFVVFLGYNIYLDPIPVIGGIVMAFGLLFGAGFIAIWLEKRSEQKRQRDYDEMFGDGPKKPESLLKMQYRAWKEKICPMVEYE